jgi:signal transduction histidine kinase
MFAFLGVVALTLGLIAPVLINRLDDYFRQQEEQSLQSRAAGTAEVLMHYIDLTIDDGWVVRKSKSGTPVLNPKVESLLQDGNLLESTANSVAQADVQLVFGTAHQDTDGVTVVDPYPNLAYDATLDLVPSRGQAQDPGIQPARADRAQVNRTQDWGLSVTLSNPYTGRASTLAAVVGLMLAMGVAALIVAMIVASFLAHRFTIPVTRLAEASRRLAEGDFSSRVPTDELATSTLELRALSVQFNTMADRLEESVSIIRRDRDYSRDLLADVSHELRTPIAAVRPFVELLQGPAGNDEAARAEFLEASAVQLDRLDWLSQNLLELSRLDSGLVLLDLRPDDVRGTIESAVEQSLATADRRGIELTASLPDRPLRIRHDPPRLGQVITNLVGNALKFTGRGGSVHVSAEPTDDGGARIEVIDTGVGIDAAELPRIFDRFYRGAEANEARGTGSGLGLSIVKSIVDMHRGTIAVESRVGRGTRFVVTLPRDPNEAARQAARPVYPSPDVGAPAIDPGQGQRFFTESSAPDEPPSATLENAEASSGQHGPVDQESRPSRP